MLVVWDKEEEGEGPSSLASSLPCTLFNRPSFPLPPRLQPSPLPARTVVDLSSAALVQHSVWKFGNLCDVNLKEPFSDSEDAKSPCTKGFFSSRSRTSFLPHPPLFARSKAVGRKGRNPSLSFSHFDSVIFRTDSGGRAKNKQKQS